METVKLGDIAKKLGLSEATVSLALNNRKGVNIKTKQKVLECAKEMGYIPNTFAQGLAGISSRTIGVVVPSLENNFYCQVVSNIEKILTEAKYNMLVAISNFDADTERKVIEFFISYCVEGIVILPTNQVEGKLEFLQKHTIPCVMCGSKYQNWKLSSVTSNLRYGSFQLFDMFLKKGKCKTALIGGPCETTMVKRRLEGISDAYKKNQIDLKFFKCFDTNENSLNYAYHIVKKILSNEKLDAIVALNDYMALGVLKACLENKLHIPEEIVIAGYDDSVMMEMATVPITSVAQDSYSIAKNAIEVILNQLNGDQTIYNIEIPATLIIRKSTKI